MRSATHWCPDTVRCPLAPRTGSALGVMNNQSSESGETVRVYLPYGSEWYGYLMRRLAERPANLSFFLKSLISKK